MSICPMCGHRVRMGSPNKRKKAGVWYHKHRVKYKKSKLVPYAGYLVSTAARDQLKRRPYGS